MASKSSPADILGGAHEIEKSLGLPDGFLGDLIMEDDWSFIIKVHALIETAVTHVLTHQLGLKKFGDIFSALDTSNTKTGKLAFVKALGLLGPDDIRFIRRLSEIRNVLVHDVRNVSFDLTNHVSSLNKNNKRNFAKTFSYSMKKSFTLSGKKTSREQLAIDKPKVATVFSLINILGFLYIEKEKGILDGNLIDYAKSIVDGNAE